MTFKALLKADYEHYCRYYFYPDRYFLLNVIRILISHPGYAAVLSYRFARFIAYDIKSKPARILFKIINFPFFLWARSYSGSEIGREAEIGGGLVLPHFGGVIVSSLARIGENCILYQGVNIVESHSQAAVVGDNAYIGAHAILVGPCVLSNNVSVGAGAVVTKQFPDNVNIAGNPAKIIRHKGFDIEPKEEAATIDATAD